MLTPVAGVVPHYDWQFVLQLELSNVLDRVVPITFEYGLNAGDGYHWVVGKFSGKLLQCWKSAGMTARAPVLKTL